MHARSLCPLSLFLVVGFGTPGIAIGAEHIGSEGDTLLAPRTVPANGLKPELSLTPRRSGLELSRELTGSTLEWGNNRFSIPLQVEERYPDGRHSQYHNALSIQWQHSLNSANLFTLSAGYGNSYYSDSQTLSPATFGTKAAAAWSGLFGADSRVTGRLFLGDEDNRDRVLNYSARRYYGLEVLGETTLWREHTPFASLAWQRSDYEAVDTATAGFASLLPRQESRSRLSAGWNWQINTNWGVRATANYRLGDDSTDSYEPDRRQYNFSTHYGFR